MNRHEDNFYFRLLGAISITTAFLAAVQPFLEALAYMMWDPKGGCMSIIGLVQTMGCIAFGIAALTSAILLTIALLYPKQKSSIISPKMIVALSALALIADITLFLPWSYPLALTGWLITKPIVVQGLFFALTHQLAQIINLVTFALSTTCITIGFCPSFFSHKEEKDDEIQTLQCSS